MVKQHLRGQLKRRPRGTPRRRKAGFIAPPADQSRRAAAASAEEIVIDIADKTCACCGGLEHRIGEDVSERLDVIPAQLRVLISLPHVD
jgi:transposase